MREKDIMFLYVKLGRANSGMLELVLLLCFGYVDFVAGYVK